MTDAPFSDAPQNDAPQNAAPQNDAPQDPPVDPIENASKPTDEWVTGDEPMTGPQHSYLQTLAREAGRELPEQLTKAQASDLIEELQASTGRGQS